MCVILGHHQDDCDENRLESLARGHVISNALAGMSYVKLENCDKVDGEDASSLEPIVVLRPFLDFRKSDFLDVLTRLKLPFARDSTPLWSVRGQTRTVFEHGRGTYKTATYRGRIPH